MKPESEVITINKRALIQAALEMEREETLKTALLSHCLDQLEDAHRKVNLVLQDHQTTIARDAFMNVLMSNEEWEKVLTDQQIVDWHDEAQQKFEQLP